MSSSPTGRRWWVLVLAIVLATALLAPTGLGATGSAELDVGAGVESTTELAAIDERVEPSEDSSATIEPALENGSGEIDVLVRFAEADSQMLMTSADATRTLQAHAATEQSALERYAEATDGVSHHRSFWIANAALVTVDRDVTSLSALAAVDGVVALTENYETVPASATASQPASSDRGGTGPTPTSGGPNLGTQSHVTNDLAAINAPDVWETFDTRGAGTSIAVLDTGVDPSHSDIDLYTDDPDDPTYPGGWAEFNDDGEQIEASTPYDAGDHGTHVSGTVAGGDASGTAIGVAPETKLRHGKVLGEESGSMSAVYAGMEWAIEADVDVIAMSLGTSCQTYAQGSIAPIQNAREAGTVVIGSIGNDGEGCTGSPGNVYDTISVGATTTSGDIWEDSGGTIITTESAWGSDVPDHWPDEYVTPTVAAPGVSVHSAVPSGYDTKTGTSMAAPHVAGTVALMQSATDRVVGPDEIESALRETAWKPDGEPDDQDVRYGDGVIDAHAAVDDVATTATLTGTVTDDVTGAPISSATVTVDDREVTTASDGTYEVEGIDGGDEYAVTIEADGYESSDEDRFIDDGETTVHDVSLAGDAAIELDVTDAHFGDQIADAAVEAEATAGERYPGTYDGDGTYTIPDVPGIDRYDVTIAAAGYQDVYPQLIVTEPGTVTEHVSMTGSGSIQVSVSDAVTEAGIEDATVAVEREDGATFEAPDETDSGGDLAVAVPGAEAAYDLSIDADGYHDAEPVSVTTSAEGDGSTAVELTGDGAVELDVTDAHFGDDISDATIEVSGEHGTYEGAYEGDGTYRIEAVPSVGGYDLTASAAGYDDGTTELDVTDAGTTVADPIALSGDATVEISAADAVTEAAIENATVAVEREDGATFEAHEETDSNGDLAVAVPGTEQAYAISVAADGYDPAEETKTIGPGDTVAHDVALAGDAAIELDVTDAHFADGIADADVTLSGSQGSYEGIHHEDGTYVIDNVPSLGNYDLTASADGYLDETVSVDVTDAGTTAADSVALSGDAAFEVDAADSVTEAAIENATVAVERADGATFEAPGEADADGMLSVTVPGTGEAYDVETAATGYEAETDATPSLGSGDEESIAIDLSGDAAVELDVTDAHFEDAITDVTVEASGERGTYPGSETDDGTLVVEALPSESAYELTAAADGYESEAVELTVADPGTTTADPIALSGAAAVEIAAADTVTETAIEAATITVERADGATFEAPGETDASGELDVIVSGAASAYDVSVGADGYETTTETAPVGEATDVTLAGDAAIELDVTDSHFTDAITDATVEGSGDQGTYEGTHDSDGTYRIDAVPSGGNYDLTVSAAGYDEESVAVDVTNPATTTAESVSLAGDATVEVVVASDGNEPVADATVTVERPDGSAFTVGDGTDADGEVTVTVPGTGDSYTLSAMAEGYEDGEVATDPVESGAVESITVTVASTESAIPGFGVGAAAVAVIAVGAGLAARRITTCP
ncbi:carboxypeptidase regulatory-like domain-containing protein [Halobacteria archaeon AArc-dxtr1]|nr:carboxypeptidase regulatory-like domain-containing protein [Halobacteria archaeon AArc-dxtr1]